MTDVSKRACTDLEHVILAYMNKLESNTRNFPKAKECDSAIRDSLSQLVKWAMIGHFHELRNGRLLVTHNGYEVPDDIIPEGKETPEGWAERVTANLTRHEYLAAR